MTTQNHITLLGVLHIARGTFVLLIGVAAFSILTGIGVIADDRTAMGVLGLIGTAIMVLLGLLAIPSIIAGIGVLMHREWGRILALVVGFLSLIDIPIGTAIGIYTIWVLLNEPGKSQFQMTAAPTAPHAAAAP
jgi:hypothetical protein